MGNKNKMQIKLSHFEQMKESLNFIKFKRDKQLDFFNSILDNSITLATGPAGTGKSFISLVASLMLLCEPKSGIDKILIAKPAVSVDEDYGFLPGDLNSKMEPFLMSLRYTLSKIINRACYEYLFEHEFISAMPIQFIRGCTIDNSVLILDEAQNTTEHQMKTILTRIGDKSKFIISGDLKQADRKNGYMNNGLSSACDKLQNLNEIGILHFDKSDIVRNDLIVKILERFENE